MAQTHHETGARDYPPPPSTTSNARTMSIIGFVCAAIGVFFVPIVFDAAAVILGILAMRNGDRLGRWVIVAGVVSLIAGIALTMALLDNAS